MTAWAKTGDAPPAPRATGSSVLVAVMLALLAFWLVQEVRVQDLLQQTVAAHEEDVLTSLISSTYVQNDQLAAHVSRLRAALAAANPGAAASVAALRATRALAGLTPVAGSGVTVTLQDAAGPRYPGEPAEFELVHDQYVLHIVGLLEGAGASAVAISGQRFVSTTAVFCGGPTIRVNGVNEGSPFVISAVGPRQAMLSALANDPDVQGWAQLVRLHYAPAPHLVVPALAQVPALSFAEAGGRIP